MKKLLTLLLASVLCVSLLAACGGEPAAPETEGEGETTPAVDETNALIVGFDPEFPPFGFKNELNEYDGFDLALAKEVCERLGWEFTPQPIDWNSKDAELKAGSINCIWNGFTMNGREDQYAWSDPYVDNSIVVVVKADSGIKTLADLAGKKVMAQSGSSASDAINDNTEFKDSLADVIELADYNMGFMELEQGSVDAVAVDLGVGTYQMGAKEGNYVMLDEPIAQEQYAIGFLKGNDALRDKVNDTLKEIAADGTMLAIAQNYVEEGLVLESLCMIQGEAEE
jgi:polar amino acid transport system substrate-binding protein